MPGAMTTRTYLLALALLPGVACGQILETDGSGGADAPRAYPIRVNVAGLKGAGLVVQNNAGDDLPIATDGTFPFAAPVASGGPYALTVKTQPSGPTQTCTFGAGGGAGAGVVSGVVGGAAITVDLTCTTNTSTIGGTLTGLQGNGLVLQNNAGDDLVLNPAQNGPFTFVTKVPSGGNYVITVKTPPNGVADETCAVTLGSGPVVSAEITTVKVTCQATKTVFVTSTLYDGDLGGLAGADAKCQARAVAAGLRGTYKAWLSDANASPATRFAQSAAPYKLVDGTVVANNWADLIDNSLASPINKTELNGPVPQGTIGCAPGNPMAWTATRANGTLANTLFTCSNWTSTVTANGSLWGDTTTANYQWTAWCWIGSCAWTAPLYCFEQ